VTTAGAPSSPNAYVSFQPKSRTAWRRWLARHHATTRGVWLVMLKGPARRLSYAEAVEEALCFGWIDSLLNPIDAASYRQLFTPRKPKSQWSKANKERVQALIAGGLMTPAGLAGIEAAKRNGSWSALDAVESLTVPPDFARALADAPVAEANFRGFSPSSKKMYLHWINNAKRTETRARRIDESIALIAKGIRGPHLRVK
jgi:uncharacterized protein YdeI (YjbR/CyaY-like superfamily)